jgi:methylated-DNA-[protein]-cysteine S-methyltransferase
MKEKPMRYDYFDTPRGRMLLVASERGLAGAYFVGQKHYQEVDQAWKRDRGGLRRARRELLEYFAGRRRRFSLPLDPQGTPFQRAVWREIAKIGFGETISYAELARRAGFPRSARAAGAATGRNPLSVIVPCHRIVGSSGALTGYAGGLGRKRAFLALEATASRR